jgi:trimeric autotransporter adhesin
MILAIAILGFVFSMHASVPVQTNAASQTAAQTTSSSDSQNQQPPSTSSDSKQASTTSNSQKTSATQSAVKKAVHKKKIAASGCDSPSSSGTASSSSNRSTGAKTSGPTGGNASAQKSGSSSASKNCPPEKIIVRQGGTTEPSIQLAGGPGGDDASQKRDATNQMLGETEGNLKKVSGAQLSSSQQDNVTQIRQFIAESKSALAAGDVESARTLAWKAKLLSDDLVKPPQ